MRCRVLGPYAQVEQLGGLCFKMGPTQEGISFEAQWTGGTTAHTCSILPSPPLPWRTLIQRLAKVSTRDFYEAIIPYDRGAGLSCV